MIEYYLFSFKSTGDATKALAKVNGKLKSARLIPLPPEISAGCGNSLRVGLDDLDKTLEILGKDDYVGIYTLSHEGRKRVIEKHVL